MAAGAGAIAYAVVVAAAAIASSTLGVLSARSARDAQRQNYRAQKIAASEERRQRAQQAGISRERATIESESFIARTGGSEFGTSLVPELTTFKMLAERDVYRILSSGGIKPIRPTDSYAMQATASILGATPAVAGAANQISGYGQGMFAGGGNASAGAGAPYQAPASNLTAGRYSGFA